MLAAGYESLTVLSIAASDNDDVSFSADTGMAECLVIARKRNGQEAKGQRIHFTSLTHRPLGFANASSIAGQIIGGQPVRVVEDGPYGGTPLMMGDEVAGQMLTTPDAGSAANWGAVRQSDYSLAQTAYALSESRLWLPAIPQPRV